jgi:hypothetical protein
MLQNQAITQLFDEFLTPEFRQKVIFIYSRKPEDLILSKLTEQEREVIDEVTSRFEGLGFKVRLIDILLFRNTKQCFLLY